MNKILKLYNNLTFKKRFIRNFKDNLLVIADKLAEIEYLREVEKDTSFENCSHINVLKEDIYEFLMYIRLTIFARPRLRRKGQKIVSKCLQEEVWMGFAIEDACMRFMDGYEYKDDYRDLVYRVYARMNELESKILDYDIRVFWNWFKSL